jgi:ATP-dependent Clp protease ATP-binding subunit ClpC
MNGPNLKSIRARKAKLEHWFRHGVASMLGLLGGLLLAGGAYCITLGDQPRLGYFALAFAAALIVTVLWHRYDLRHLPLDFNSATIDGIMEPDLLAVLKPPLTPRRVWIELGNTPEGRFVTQHLLLPTGLGDNNLSDNEADMSIIWRQAEQLVGGQAHRTELHGGVLAAAILLTSPDMQAFLTANKLGSEDVVEVLGWIDRQLSYIHSPKPNFGGFGRDWATGFTPTLDQFGQNMSVVVQAHGGMAHYLSHSDLLDGIVSGLERGAGVALVGPDGAGKTTLMYALTQRLLEGRDPELKYYQVVSLNASLILSHSGQQLENLMLTLFSEATAAGNIILFLDDAQLFFSTGTGAFDMSQILMPVLKNRNLKIVAAFTPIDWQQLQANRQALAGSFTSVTLTEPDQEATFKVIEDTALVMEHQNRALISYAAIREAFRLSGQFMQDQAYPGKAVNLIEQAMPYATEHILTAQSIQTAVEKTKGVKVSAAQAPEADMLLNLEDRIHQRMINQKQAVEVVASALRRGRAGVSNPTRPVGSFLFLGPTGVGKTELARSLAAVYFGDEHQMIRLDMSEYQQPTDVARLLAGGGQHERSLLLAIRQQPFSVVLLDEIEKAHPNILNLLLQMLDEGQLTDQQGRPASFRSSIIIATSNAGAADITAQVRAGTNLADFERPLIDKLISAGQFKPELINRFDEIVLFRPLNEQEMVQVAQIMLASVNKTLQTQQIRVELTEPALQQIVHLGYDPEFGARPMRRIIQKTVENAIAVKILRGEARPGSVITLDVPDLALGDQSQSQPLQAPINTNQPTLAPPGQTPQPPAPTSPDSP